jgi:hypothetical protein
VALTHNEAKQRRALIAQAMIDGQTYEEIMHLFGVTGRVLRKALSEHREAVESARRLRHRLRDQPPPPAVSAPHVGGIGPGLRRQIELAKAEAENAPLYKGGF